MAKVILLPVLPTFRGLCSRLSGVLHHSTSETRSLA
jgi:hypothetical protein